MEIRIYASFEPKSERFMLFARTVGVRQRDKIKRVGRTYFMPQKVRTYGGITQ